MAVFIAVAGLVAIAAFIVWRLMVDEKRLPPGAPLPPGGMPVESLDEPPQEPYYHAWTAPPPVMPTVLEPAEGKSQFAHLHALDRVSDGIGLLSISPDGREAMTLHDDTSITIFDVESGRALRTWRDVCPKEWLAHFSEAACFSCAGRRLFLGWMRPGLADDHENVVIDLAAGEARLVYACGDGQDSIMSAAMSADGRFVVGICNYAKSHPAFDLDRPSGVTDRGDFLSGFGDYVLEAGTLFPTMAMSADGRWCAFEIGDGDVQVISRGDEPAEDDACALAWWPSYGEHMRVSGDDAAARFVFSDDGAHLLVVERDGGLVLADLAAGDYKLLKPFTYADDDEEPFFLDVTWVHGRMAVIVEVFEPTPRLALIDLDAGSVEHEWRVDKETLQRLRVAPTGAYGLLNCDDGVLRVMPLAA